jgi:hypothetical protein
MELRGRVIQTFGAQSTLETRRGFLLERVGAPRAVTPVIAGTACAIPQVSAMQSSSRKQARAPRATGKLAGVVVPKQDQTTNAYSEERGQSRRVFLGRLSMV